MQKLQLYKLVKGKQENKKKITQRKKNWPSWVTDVQENNKVKFQRANNEEPIMENLVCNMHWLNSVTLSDIKINKFQTKCDGTFLWFWNMLLF